jgi:hypothetical protein
MGRGGGSDGWWEADGVMVTGREWDDGGGAGDDDGWGGWCHGDGAREEWQ